MGGIKEFWLNKSECTGCGVCANICPQKAITMCSDSLGFKYPTISADCINCNLCEKICSNRLSLKRNSPIKIYACWSKDQDNRFYSTSGGMFGELVTPILQDGGYVIGAAYDEENLVEHICIHSINDLRKVQQSKYLQSDPKNIYIEIKKLLENNNKVAFCGTPCQVAGLRSYLKCDYGNLLLIDFICRGVNSPKAYKAWLKEIEDNYSSQVTSVWFKYKVGGWKSSPKRTKLQFQNGEDLILEGENNLYMTGYLGPNLYIRPSCGRCDFKGADRLSDLTLADFWGIEKEYDDDRGTSMVMINSQKGKDAWNKVANKLNCIEKNVEMIIRGNPCFNDSVMINPRSSEFLESLDNEPFSIALSRFYKPQGPLKRIYIKLKSMIRNIFK